MNIVMLTNTFTPLVGGVSRSVAAFAADYRRRGHGVLVVAPEFENQPPGEVDVVRIPAIQHFNGSDFSAMLPVSGLLTDILDDFMPDIVHVHHPYLLGMTALRIARYRELPLVFTHHTLYEQYTHYVPGDSPAFRRFVIELATRYANLCDQVFAPSESIATLLRKRGVIAPIEVVPTGVDVERFAQGDGAGFRSIMGIPEVLGDAVASFLKRKPSTHFLVVGKGPSDPAIRTVFEREGLRGRLHVAGILSPSALVDAYHAMDVFAFASKSETQGMVLTEAMAAGVPVVGLDAPGVREVVCDKQNGRLLKEETREAFCAALQWMADLPAERLRPLRQGALKTAEAFSMTHLADKALSCYKALHKESFVARPQEYKQWERVLHLVKAEWEILKGMAEAVDAAFSETESQDGASS
jgi:glycosyltransferase involved in cell wall biosynthesis